MTAAYFLSLLAEVALQQAFESLAMAGFVALAMQSPLRGAAEVVLLQTQSNQCFFHTTR